MISMLSPVTIHITAIAYKMVRITIGVFQRESFASPAGNQPSSQACMVGLGAHANFAFSVEIRAKPAPQITKNT